MRHWKVEKVRIAGTPATHRSSSEKALNVEQFVLAKVPVRIVDCFLRRANSVNLAERAYFMKGLEEFVVGSSL